MVRPPKASFVLFGAILLEAPFVEAQEPRDEGVSPISAEEADDSPQVGSEISTVGTPSAVAVHLSVTNSELAEEDIFKALANEFGVPVVPSEGEQGLYLLIDDRTLEASYRDEEGRLIERSLQLPQDSARQLDTIALLSGNIARDEAGELLEELRAETGEEATLPEDVPSPPIPPPEKEQDGLESSDSSPPAVKKENEEAQEPPSEEKKPASSEAEARSKMRPLLPQEDATFAFWGDVSFPKQLDEKKTHFHLGAVYSDIGALEGFAGNLFVLRNRGRGREFAGHGAQMAVFFVDSQGFFEGVHVSAIVAKGQGGIQGFQAAGIVSQQEGETKGGQAAGVVSLSSGNIDGGQGAGVFARTRGNIDGGQGAGVVAITTGSLDGIQGAGVAAIAGGKMEGFQLGAITWARELDGMQLGAVNASTKSMDGVQGGMINYSGDFHGTQVGLVNWGGDVDGAQLGLINVAHDVDGVALAPINIIPGTRNQIVTYGSWSPAASTEGAPAGPLVHLGLKVMPDPFYTQLSFGIGAEAEECPSGLLPGDASCQGNGIVYAPGFAVGLRGRIAGGLFSEIDLQYQFEKAFSASGAHRHATLLRAALGYEFGDDFAVFVGGGPRMDVSTDDAGNATRLVTFDPHAFAGIQVF